MKKTFFILAMLSIFMLSLSAYTTAISKDLQSNIIRLHILARSNSDYDQKTKLAVRDEVISAVSDIPITDTKRFLTCAENTANAYLLKNNIPYHATAEYGTFIFPKKTYGNITLPKGKYTGVRIILDEGKGENWWCVMYPPLCVSDKSDEAQAELKASLTDESYKLITKKPKVRVKVLELLSEII